VRAGLRADQRDTLFKVLCTADERDRLQAAADRMGVNLSTRIRLTTLAAAKS
jgi:hypothetical protein